MADLTQHTDQLVAERVGPLTGKVFGEWTVGDCIGTEVKTLKYVCTCQCGTTKHVLASNLASGRTKSCGCGRSKRVSDKMSRHGHSQTGGRRPSPTYSTWGSMTNRCNNPNNHSYSRYGGRGIKVCERWLVFENFLADMGEKPAKGMSIERLDVNGNYEPGNCTWATHKVQARNTRRTKLNADIVSAIRSNSVSTKSVVDATGCSPSTVVAARTGQNWKDV